jgi:hypothetical protein
MHLLTKYLAYRYHKIATPRRRSTSGCRRRGKETDLLVVTFSISKLSRKGQSILRVTKLIDSKINLINQNRENTKNDLVAVNMNNASTTHIKINSYNTTQARQQNKDLITGSPL